MSRSLNDKDVEAVIQGLSQEMPKGARRYKALMAALKERYGQNTDFTSVALKRIEDWASYSGREQKITGAYKKSNSPA